MPPLSVRVEAAGPRPLDGAGEAGILVAGCIEASCQRAGRTSRPAPGDRYVIDRPMRNPTSERQAHAADDPALPDCVIHA